MRNQIWNSEKYPHSDFLDKGILSLTMLAVKDDSSTQVESLENMIQILFKQMRMFDTLDEQLHAGSTIYILFGLTRLATINTVGICLGIFSIILISFNVIQMFDHLAKTKPHLIKTGVRVFVFLLAGQVFYFSYKYFISDVEEVNICYPIEHSSKEKLIEKFDKVSNFFLISIGLAIGTYVVVNLFLWKMIVSFNKDIVYTAHSSLFKTICSALIVIISIILMWIYISMAIIISLTLLPGFVINWNPKTKA